MRLSNRSLTITLAAACLSAAILPALRAEAAAPSYRLAASLAGVIPAGVRKVEGKHFVVGSRSDGQGGPRRAIVRNGETGEERVLPRQEQSSDYFGDTAQDVTPDGRIVVGSTEGPSGVLYPSRWNAAGELELIDPPGAGRSELIGINAEGTAIGNGPQGGFYVTEESFVGEPMPLSDGAVLAEVSTIVDGWVGGFQVFSTQSGYANVATVWEMPAGTPHLLLPLDGDTDCAVTGIARIPRGDGTIDSVPVGYSVLGGRRTGVQWDAEGVPTLLPAPDGVSDLTPEHVAGKWCVAVGRIDDAYVHLLIDLSTGQVLRFAELFRGIEAEILAITGIAEDGWVAVVMIVADAVGGGLCAPVGAPAKPKPDLVPSFHNLDVRPATSGKGLTIRGFLRITNVGKKRANASRLHLFLTDGRGMTRLKNFQIRPLRKGESINFRIIHAIPRPGRKNWDWIAVADATGNVKESDEANNRQTLRIVNAP
jgi:hypothetical protein